MNHTPSWKQFIADIWFKDNIPNLEDFAKLIINKLDLHVVDKYTYKFNPWKTIVYVLSESHFIIHTYPEHKYIWVDIYTCWNQNPYNAEKIIRENFSIKKLNVSKLKRWI